ncbi:MAG: hypothetical protein ACYSWO_23655, partial [Planctomycetota bacterium]
MKRFAADAFFKLKRDIRSETIFLVLCMVALPFQTTAAELPEVEVTNVRRVFHDGHHNAFTDLVRFRGRFYLTFRSCPDGHMVHPT